jgi:hypothetical protein
MLHNPQPQPHPHLDAVCGLLEGLIAHEVRLVVVRAELAEHGVELVHAQVGVPLQAEELLQIWQAQDIFRPCWAQQASLRLILLFGLTRMQRRHIACQRGQEPTSISSKSVV